MTSLLVGLVVVLLAPIMITGWRVSMVGLGLQGLLMGWWVLEAGRAPSPGVAVLLVDLLLVRGLLVPLSLYRALRARHSLGREELPPANLFSWALAAVMLLLALRFGRVLGGGDAALATHFFVATTAFLLGFLVLGMRKTPYSQIVGVLRLENAVALFELASPEPPPLPIQLGLLGAFVLTAATLNAFLRRLPPAGATLPPSVEGPTL